MEELIEPTYYRDDIYKAFDMGFLEAVTVFEELIGIPYIDQGRILSKIKEQLGEDQDGAVMENKTCGVISLIKKR